MNRRKFLLAAAASAASTAFAQSGGSSSSGQQMRWTMFSRHLQCLTTQAFSRDNPYETGVVIGEGAAEGGFNAINLTVRIDGHVEPALVKTNLSPMLRGIRSTGTRCDHITTNVLNLQSDYAEDVLATAAENGVRYYRWGTYVYDYSAAAYGQGLIDQLDLFRREAEALAAYNTRLGLTALYHTYSGTRVGASLWDVMYILKDQDPDALGLNFDIGHMLSEGVRSWINDLRFAMPYVRGASLKDATYVAAGEGEAVTVYTPGAMEATGVSVKEGEAIREFRAAGKGSVDWVEYFRLLHEGGFSGPAESHLEFDYEGNNLLESTWWQESYPFIVTRQEAIEIMRSELGTYRATALAAGWQDSQLI